MSNSKMVRLPYMRDVPDTWLFEPWKMPTQLNVKGLVIKDATQPLVELASATRTAKQRLHQRRQQADVKEGKQAVLEKHTSHKTFRVRPDSLDRKVETSKQLGFDF